MMHVESALSARYPSVLLAFALASALCGGVARAQETWAPVVMFDGASITLNGTTTAIANGPIPPATSNIFDVTPDPPLLSFPNGIAENRLTNEWIVADSYHSRLLRFATDHNSQYPAGAYIGSLDVPIGIPYSPIVDDDGVMLVPDFWTNRLYAFTPSGSGYTASTISTFTNGTATDSFNQPRAVAFVPDPANGMHLTTGVGSVIVLDSANNRVLKLQTTGGVGSGAAWTMQLAFGSQGIGPSKFYFPTGLARDTAGRIYVSDPNNTQLISIQVFDAGGNPLQTISEGLSSPWSLALDANSRLFVADTANNRIAVFAKFDAANPAASLAPIPASIGSANLPLGGIVAFPVPNPAGPMGSLQEPTAMAFDQFGRLVVADTDDYRVEIFDKAKLNVTAIAYPQTMTVNDATVTVRVDVALPNGDTGTIHNVVPAVPATSLSPGESPVVTAPPRCVIIYALDQSCRPLTDLAAANLSLAVGGDLEFGFMFDRITSPAEAIGPVWFSVSATGLDASNAPVQSGTAETYAVAVRGDLGRPPTITGSLKDPANGPAPQGWYDQSPVYVDLAAAVPNPGSADGQLQEIQYAFGSSAPAEGAFYSCFNVFTSDTPDQPTCQLPIFKEGITTVWYRALSTIGLYDHLTPSAVDPTVNVPGWTSLVVQLDFSPPIISSGGISVSSMTLPGRTNGWYNVSPLQYQFQIADLGSGVNTVTASAGATISLTSGQAFATVTFPSITDGSYSYTVSATDLAGNASSTTIAVKIDSIPPVASLKSVSSPSGIVTVTGSGAKWSRTAVTAAFSATDNGSGFDQNGTKSTNCNATLSTGTGSLTCTFTDWAGNQTTPAAVGPYSIDTTPPAVTSAITYVSDGTPATGVVIAGITYFKAAVKITFTATDGGSGFSTASPTGTSTQSFTVSGAAQALSPTFTDVVGNSTKVPAVSYAVSSALPTIAVPANMTVVATKASGAVVTYTASAKDASSGAAIPVACAPPSGATFPLGTTIVTCTATNAAGDKATATFKVTVNHSAPVCTADYASPSTLWPPSHQLVSIAIDGVTNADGGAITYSITSIFQDEPTSGLGNGDVPVDGFGVGTSQAQVRAERGSSGNGRMYHVKYTAQTAGGSCSGDVTVGVPLYFGGTVIDGGALYDSTIAPPNAADDTASTLKGVATTINVLSNDSDPLNYALTVTAVSAASHGTTKLNPNGTITYTPVAGYAGPDAFTYTVSDGHGSTDTATVTVTINAHSSGDGCDHDSHRNSHRDSDGCDHDRDAHNHYAGDGCDHDKHRNGHYNGDGCDHDR
jgi:hypothetical protein